MMGCDPLASLTTSHSPIKDDASAPPTGPTDRFVMAKHADVYPSAEELTEVQTIVSHVEHALKTVSDEMDSPNEEKDAAEAVRWARASYDLDLSWLSFVGVILYSRFLPSSESPDRVLHGVMRVGLVAKGLLLKGDKDLELVLLCSNKPTATLLKQVAEKMTDQLEVVFAFIFYTLYIVILLFFYIKLFNRFGTKTTLLWSTTSQLSGTTFNIFCINSW